MRKPLEVKVTWTDAVSEPRDTSRWAWKPEVIAKIGEEHDLVTDRGTIGWLGYIDEETEAKLQEEVLPNQSFICRATLFDDIFQVPAKQSIFVRIDLKIRIAGPLPV